MRAVWPGIAVTDDSLVQCIHEIRRAFQDDTHTLLKTKPKRGYRLVLPAEAVSGAAEDQPRGESPDDARPAERAKVSIAVLPFVNMSSDPEQE